MRFSKYLPFLLFLYLLLPSLSALLNFSPKIFVELNKKELFNALLISLSSATVTTSISGIFGIPLAYIIARSSGKLKSFIEAVIISPLVLPPIVTGLLLLSILSPKGFIGALFYNFDLRITRTFFAIVLAQLAVASPFTIISAKSAFEEIDVKLEFASRLLGKSSLETFLKISLPLAKKGVIAGLMMTFIRSVGEFGATFMLAYFPKTLPIYLYTSYLSGGIERSAPIAFILWLFSVTFIIIIRYIGGRIAET